MTRLPVEQSESSATAVDDALLAIVRELGGELHLREAALRTLSLHTAIDADLGLDSLARIELLSRVERRFAVRLSTEAITHVTTLADLRDVIVRAGEEGGRRLVKAVSGLVLDKIEAGPMSRQIAACDTLTEVLEWHLNAHPDRPHIQLYDEAGEGERLSFRDLYVGAYALARGMRNDGLNGGDRVAIMLPTGKDYFLAFLGVLLAGGVPVSLYPPTRPSQLEDHLRRHKKILENCGASRLIAFREVRSFARLLQAQLPSLRRVHGVGDLIQSTTANSKPVQSSTAHSTPVQSMPASLPRLRGKDTAFLQYTSGSTGNPKGVVLSHANLLSNIRALGDRMQVNSRDVIVSWLPLYHDMGLIGCWLGSLYYACLFVVMSPLDFIARPERWLWAIHRYRGTISAAPNFAYELCLKRIDDHQLEGLDLGSWRVACNGAEAVSPHTLRRFSQRFKPYGFRERSLMPVYGLAENSVGLTFPPLGRPPLIDRVQRDIFSKTGVAEPARPDDRNALEFVACGTPLKGCEIRVVDELNRELPRRQEGRLQFRGPSATSGYFQNPAETRKLFQGSWLNSGDRAYMAERDVVITGRGKDIVIHGGRNLYPEELEAAVGDIPGIRKGCVAVFGSKDPKTATEKLVVLAETRAVEPKAREALRAAINLRAVDIIGMPPDEVVLAPPHTVLKTSSGKIRRSANREQYERGRTGPQQHSFPVQITRLLASAVVPQLKRTGRIAAAGAYGCWFWSVSAVLAPFIWLSVVATPVLSWRWTVMRGWGRLLFALLGIRLTVEGERRLPPEEMRCVYVANHSSYLDAFVLITAFPRNITFVTKAELKAHWLSRTALDKINAVYVTRSDRRQSAEDADRLLEQAQMGKRLFFFPEGTFTRVSGVYPFHMGAFLTAVKARAAIVPVAIRGTRTVLRPEYWFPRRAPVTITIDDYLPSAPLSSLQDKSYQDGSYQDKSPQEAQWQAALRLRDQARAAILKNSGEPDLAEERPPIW